MSKGQYGMSASSVGVPSVASGVPGLYREDYSAEDARVFSISPREVDFETKAGSDDKTPEQALSESTDKLVDVGDVDDPEFQRYRILKQFALVGCWISIGLFSSILGPTLPDLRVRLDVGYDELSWVVVGRDVGMIFGSLLGGFINERFYRSMDLILSISLFMAATSSGLAPNLPEFGLVAGMFVINGFSEGLINTGGITMVMHMWGKKKSGAAQQFLHFGFGVGSLLCPQIAKPFLGSDDEDSTFTTTPAQEPFSSSPLVDDSRIEIAYGIVAALVAIFAFVMLGFHFASKPALLKKIYQPTTSFSRDMVSPGSCARGHVWIGVQLLVLLFIYYFQISGGSRLVANFLFSFAVEGDLNMPKSEAANLNSVYWIGFTCGRGVGVLVAKFVPVIAMTAGDVAGVLVTIIAMFFFGNDYATAMWVLVPILGLFMGPLFPQGLTWSNYYLDMNPLGVMILLIGGNCGGFAYQFVMGGLFEKNPANLLKGLLFFSCAVTALYAILQTVAGCQNRKLKTTKCED